MLLDAFFQTVTLVYEAEDTELGKNSNLNVFYLNTRYCNLQQYLKNNLRPNKVIDTVNNTDSNNCLFKIRSSLINGFFLLVLH